MMALVRDSGHTLCREDAPADVISALSGKLGMLRGISSKALYSRVPECGAKQ